MLVFITVLVILLGFIFQSNKKYTWIMYIWMWIIFAFNTFNSDYEAYEIIYNRIAANDSRMISTYEESFVLLCKMGSKIFNWNYQQFYVFIATFSTILFAIIIKLYCNGIRQNLVISLYMVFLHWIFICQYRTYLAVLFVLFGLYFLHKIENWKGTLLFLVFLLIGVTFHRMAALYIILLAAKYFDMKVIMTFVPIIMVIMLQARNPAYSSFLSKYVAGYKMDRWLYSDSSRTLIGILILIFVRTMIVAIEYHCYNKNLKSGIKCIYLNSQEFILKVSLLCLSILPLEFFKKDYERLIRLPLFLSFVFLAEYLENSKIDKHHLPLNVVVYSGYFVLYIISFYVSFHGWFEHNLTYIIKNNMLIPF